MGKGGEWELVARLLGQRPAVHRGAGLGGGERGGGGSQPGAHHDHHYHHKYDHNAAPAATSTTATAATTVQEVCSKLDSGQKSRACGCRRQRPAEITIVHVVDIPLEPLYVWSMPRSRPAYRSPPSRSYGQQYRPSSLLLRGSPHLPLHSPTDSTGGRNPGTPRPASRSPAAASSAAPGADRACPAPPPPPPAATPTPSGARPTRGTPSTGASAATGPHTPAPRHPRPPPSGPTDEMSSVSFWFL